MLNKAIIMGRLVRDPELKTTNTGMNVCSFSVAVERRFVKQGEERQTDFLECVAWGKQAEFLSKYFNKGRMINVVGSIQVRKWQDKEGNNRYSTEIIADEINFCGDKSGDNASRSGGGYNNSSYSDQPHDGGFTTIDATDDLPF